MENKKLKELIFTKLQAIIDQKIIAVNREIESAKESRNNDTKNSAGDKYETGRAMAQMELDKNEAQLRRTVKLKKELSLINIQKKYDKVEFGSLVMTNHENYFISFGIGKVAIENTDYYAISLASPIGQVFLHKKQGDSIIFQGREIFIQDIS
ncbi:MAG: 3-oxoacyl-ACP synthase [Bacteroidales bacterium]|nr:3-oxoacyl-ACP synthase [Bacteroidales bacterium]